jgi:hypothetical protein
MVGLILTITATCLGTFGMAFSVYLSFKYLNKCSEMLMPKTLALFRSLIIVLFLDLCCFSKSFLHLSILTYLFLGILIWISIVITAWSYFSGIKFASIIICFVEIYFQSYPLFTYLLVLSYIKPYKMAVMRLFRLEHHFGQRQSLISTISENQ